MCVRAVGDVLDDRLTGIEPFVRLRSPFLDVLLYEKDQIQQQ